MSPYRASGPLAVVVLTYVRPLEEVDAQMAAHVAFLDQGFAQGLFLVAGRQHPRTGGIVLCRGEAHAARALFDADPFVTSGVATVEVIAFSASFALPGFAALLA